jgi:glycolate oxidase iron-sulfur subunit
MLDSTRPSAADRRPGPESPLADAAGTGVPEQDASAPGDSESYALLEGCVMAGLYPYVHTATRRTLARRRFRERQAPGQGCCGALHAHAGRLDGARDLARANIEAFERSGARWIVTNSAGCGAALRDYPSWFREDRELRGRAEELAARVRDVTELLAGSEPGSVAMPRSALRIAYDAPCHLLHAQGVRDAPMEVLTAAGYDVTPLPSWERCCGGAGLYNLLQPELSDQVLARKLREIREGEFDLVATGNPGCMMFLASGLARAGASVGVVHPVQLVDRAEWNAGQGTQVSRSGTQMNSDFRRWEGAR